MNKEIPNILTLANKEKFRRQLLITSRLIGILLVFAIFWIGFIQIKYVAKINSIKTEYGPNAYCYLCGLENGRSCSCNYIGDLEFNNLNFDLDSYLENIATSNVIPCEDRNHKPWDIDPEINLTK